ncbi:protein containing the rna recognition motif [Malassezia pachydermatis]|uniref:Protein containing the rna recognition motif n=1 Tax=Malassezia pachydermatis TaxID=77020 RepID=A0A0M8MTM0_9BASI|nr:protein containing the rna recognition motif [Malassezia pachydermatis]KOS16507.1 protein containing the rna recognition motif [Malassezia pachydermatis]
MLFPQEEAPAVKQWLIRELEPLCDADPDVLADYVLALFKNDTSEPELIAMLNEQLLDFLEGNTQSFVTKAVETLKSRSYGAGQTRKRDDDDEGNTGMDEVTDTDTGANPSKRQAYATEGAEAMNEDGTTPQARPRRMARAPGSKGLCRDYHNSGYCARGNQCRFQHSDDSMTGPMPPPGMFPPGMPFMPPFPMGPDGAMPPPGMMPPPEQMAQMMQHMQAMAASGEMPDMMMMMGGGRGRGMPRGRGGGRGGRGGRGGGPHAAPVARSADTIVIENIPPEYLDLAHVNEYFKKFGTITNIDVDEPGKKAVVTYATHAEAENAHKSPDVIFGNRFVKVYFQRIERAPPSKPHYMTDKGSNVYLAPELRNAAMEQAPMDEEKRRIVELRKKKQALVQMQLAEQKALLQKLEEKDLTPQGRKSIMTMLEKLSTDIKGATEMLKRDMEPSDAMDTNATTEELQAKLAHLKQEAAALGLDPSGHPAMRGGFRGRGRGGMRGFGAPRGRGRGAPMMANRSLTLDNRTTKVGISGLPAQYDPAALQAYVQQFGECDAMEQVGHDVIVTYKTRLSAERAMRAGTSIPNVGDATFSWVDAPPAAAPSAAAAAPPTSTHATLADAAAELDEHAERENWKR